MRAPHRDRSVGTSRATSPLACLLLLAAACGDDGATSTATATDTGGASTSTTATTSTTEATTTSAGETAATTTPTTTASTTTGAPVCGDGVLDPGEACDDGNLEDRDGCSNACSTDYVPDPVTMGMDLPAVVPVLRIDVGGQPIQKDVEIPGTLEIFEDHAGTLQDLDGLAPTFTSPIGMQGRGNFTWTLPKKGYAFELQGAGGASLDAAILGLPAGSDFALYACYTDKTCLRNALVFALGQELGRWSPRTRFVELVVDGQYLGLYMVWERIRRDKTRVDIDKPAPTAQDGYIEGGYIIRHEGGGKGQEVIGGVTYDRDFATQSGTVYTYHYPAVDTITPEQSAFIRGHLQAFEDAMIGDPAGHAAWIDVASWVDRAIVEELTNNWDGYVHSIYMTKDSQEDGGRLGMGPLWDFDLAFANGNVTGYNCATDTWAYQIVRPAPDDVPDYWLALFADPAFQDALACRWHELRAGPIALATIDARIAAWVEFTADARARDQATWKTVGTMIFPNCFSRPTYAEEVDALRAWIADRITWLDGQLADPGTCP